MNARFGSIAVGLIALASIGAAPATILHARGQFTVQMQPEAQDAAPARGLATGRLTLIKTFTGDLAGIARGKMVSVGTPGKGFAAFVVLDQFTGKLGDREGAFVLLYRGSMTGPSAMAMEIVVPAGSGTGALAGIEGSMTITLKGEDHLYDLAYTLPPK